MISIRNIEVFGFRHALRNMRNPKESWKRSDSKCVVHDRSLFGPGGEGEWPWEKYGIECVEGPRIGPCDLKLLTDLARSGSEHRKVLRTIVVNVDIAIGRDLWQELNTYQIATVRNSCSTMHKLGHRDLTVADFQDGDVDQDYLERVNGLIRLYRASEFKDTSVLRQLKHRLVEGFVQLSGFHFNYENALNMYFQREFHRMDEWSDQSEVLMTDPGDVEDARHGLWPSICCCILHLPYMSSLISAIQERRTRGGSEDVAELRRRLAEAEAEIERLRGGSRGTE
jgi:hypothetical protein